MNQSRQAAAGRGEPGHRAPGPLRILRVRDVVVKTGLSRSAIYERIKTGSFPKSVPLGERAVGFLEHEIDAFIGELIDRRGAA